MKTELQVYLPIVVSSGFSHKPHFRFIVSLLDFGTIIEDEIWGYFCLDSNLFIERLESKIPRTNVLDAASRRNMPFRLACHPYSPIYLLPKKDILLDSSSG